MGKYDNLNNLVDLFETAVQKFSKNLLFGTKDKEKKVFNWVTYGEVGKRVDNLRGGLVEVGIKEGDSVGFIGNNRTEWAIAAFATYGRKAKFIPMYEAELVKIWKYIVEDSGVKVLLVANDQIYEQVKSFVKDIKSLKKIFIVDTEAKNSMASLEKMGEEKPVESLSPDPDDVAGLVYTSGTTGDPKGVMLSHKNFLTNAIAGNTIYPMLKEDSVSLSILPWAHAYGQTAELYNWLLFGGSIGFMESVLTLAEDLQLVKPTFLIAVPRIFNKIYDGIWAKMNDEGGLPKKLFVMGVESAQKKRLLAEEGKSSLFTNIKVGMANAVVFSKIKEKFGGKLVASLTASATMNPDVANFFFDIGIPVCDAYGLSETSPAVTMNSPIEYKLGSVGRVLENIKVVIDSSVVEDGAKDGEIIVYGPNVMLGYNNKPEATKAVMTKDGGFRTGDRGRIDEDGYLFITGRIKEQFKLQNGKYVFPSGIEENIRLVPNVANAMIFGDGKPFNIALIIPDFEVLGKYAKKNGISDNPADLVNNKEVTDMITKEILDLLATKCGSYEIPKKFIFIDEDFSLENGMLTQTMKLKRRVVIEKYKDQIEKLYK